MRRWFRVTFIAILAMLSMFVTATPSKVSADIWTSGSTGNATGGGGGGAGSFIANITGLGLSWSYPFQKTRLTPLAAMLY